VTCEHAHAFVLVDGRCGGCGSVLTASGRFDVAQGEGLRFLAPPFGSDADARCRTGGDHQPDAATGVCACCSTRLDAFTDPETTDLRWFETTY
jgi:hypothetical protein